MENYLKLGPRLRRFAEAIAEGETAKDAVLRVRPHAKWAKQIGHAWRHKPVVSAAIDELEVAAILEAGVTRRSILVRLNEVANRCMQAEPVRDRKGEPTGEYQFDSAGANRALELLGKYHKLFTDKAEVTGKDGTPLDGSQRAVAAAAVAAAIAASKDPAESLRLYQELL